MGSIQPLFLQIFFLPLSLFLLFPTAPGDHHSTFFLYDVEDVKYLI